MGMDLYLNVAADDSEEISDCWRNLASDCEVLEGLVKKGCKLFKFIHFGDETDPKPVDPAKLLPEVLTAIKLCSKLPESQFEAGKVPFLEELDEVKAAVEKAKLQKVKISLQCM